MMLKYSDKFSNICFRVTKSNTKNSDVYTSAKRAIQFIKEIKGNDNTPVMGQGISPNAPISFDEESPMNLKVLVEEKIELFPLQGPIHAQIANSLNVQ